MCIITELHGGLGNQMFQYAAGRTLAHLTGLPLKLDISKFGDDKLRSYKLNLFNIQEDIATPIDLEPFLIPEDSLPLFFYRVKNFILPRHQKKIFIEKKEGYDEDFRRISNECLLKGYWQSEKYFKDIDKIIREEFTPSIKPNRINQELLMDIEETESVSLHVRRGDYINNPAIKKVHGFVGKEYYREAIAYFEARLEAPFFFVFSDDIQWAKKNIRAHHPLIFVDYNGVEKDYEDLRLMRNCKFHIIANSSFSWWGAWLSNYKEKKVIAPQNWFTPEKMRRKENIDIVPDRWIRL